MALCHCVSKWWHGGMTFVSLCVRMVAHGMPLCHGVSEWWHGGMPLCHGVSEWWHGGMPLCHGVSEWWHGGMPLYPICCTLIDKYMCPFFI